MKKFILGIGFMMLVMALAEKLGEIITMDMIMALFVVVGIIAAIILVKLDIEEWRGLKNGQVR